MIALRMYARVLFKGFKNSTMQFTEARFNCGLLCILKYPFSSLLYYLIIKKKKRKKLITISTTGDGSDE
jgi:hypothetical protein